MLIENRMRSRVILAMAALTAFLLAVGCIATATYTYALVQVGRPQETRNRYGEVAKIGPTKGKYLYEDQLLSAVFNVTKTRINLEVQNKTDHSLKVIWDKTVFIDATGKSGRVVHEDVKYTDLNASQPPSVILAHGILVDFVLPTGHVYYRGGRTFGKYASSPGGWKELDLPQPSEDNKGKRFGLLVPIETQGVVNDYTFWFEIQNVSVISNR